MTLHVYPVDDSREHDTGGDSCWCEPHYEYEAGRLDHILVHNSAEGGSETMPDNLVITIQGSLFIMGKLDGRQLFNPKVVSVVPAPEGLRVFMNNLVGNPTFLTFGNSVCYYTPRDEAVINLYIQVTSGIVVPQLQVVKA